jgi:DNA repair protein RecO (recombination protein O)
MPLYTTEALILRTYKLKEADRIVVFLTRDRGKKRGVAHGARRMQSNFGGALEPLSRVGVTYFEKEQRELVSLNYAEAISSPLWAGGADALGHSAYFAELLDEWAPEGDPNETLFRLGASVVEALGAGGRVARLARYFEYWLLRLQGLYPSLLTCRSCGAALGREKACAAILVVGEHSFWCQACGGGAAQPRGVGLSGDALAFLRAAAATSPGALDGLSVSDGALRELERVHGTLIRMHLEKDLRSTRVLRDMRHTE